MSECRCEGFIKEVRVTKDGKVTFTFEPVAPYLFEKKSEDGKTEWCLLFVDDNLHNAEIVKPTHEFVPPGPSDLNTLLIAKANHMKVRLVVNSFAEPIPVAVLTVF